MPPAVAADQMQAHEHSFAPDFQQQQPPLVPQQHAEMKQQKRDKVAALAGELEMLDGELVRLKRENKQFERLEKIQAREIKDYTAEREEIPGKLQQQAAEVAAIRTQLEKSREKHEQTWRLLLQREEQLRGVKSALEQLEEARGAERLGERHEVRQKLELERTGVAEREKKISALRRHLANTRKNRSRENVERGRTLSTQQRALVEAKEKNAELRKQIVLKEAEIAEVNNFRAGENKPLAIRPPPHHASDTQLSKKTERAADSSAGVFLTDRAGSDTSAHESPSRAAVPVRKPVAHTPREPPVVHSPRDPPVLRASGTREEPPLIVSQRNEPDNVAPTPSAPTHQQKQPDDVAPTSSAPTPQQKQPESRNYPEVDTAAEEARRRAIEERAALLQRQSRKSEEDKRREREEEAARQLARQKREKEEREREAKELREREAEALRQREAERRAVADRQREAEARRAREEEDRRAAERMRAVSPEDSFITTLQASKTTAARGGAGQSQLISQDAERSLWRQEAEAAEDARVAAAVTGRGRAALDSRAVALNTQKEEWGVGRKPDWLAGGDNQARQQQSQAAAPRAKRREVAADLFDFGDDDFLSEKPRAGRAPAAAVNQDIWAPSKDVRKPRQNPNTEATGGRMRFTEDNSTYRGGKLESTPNTYQKRLRNTDTAMLGGVTSPDDLDTFNL